MKRYILLIAILFTAWVLPGQTYKVIVNSSNTTTTITTSDLSKHFLKKVKKWNNGDKVMPVDQSASSAVRKDFSKAIHKKSVSAIKSYWQQYVFAGSGTPPIEKKNDTEVIEYVKKNSGAIGYVSTSAKTAGVKEITVN